MSASGIFLLLLATPTLADESTNPEDSSKDVKRFLAQYCVDCHDSQTLEGDREFESFRLPIENEQQLVMADEIVDQLTLRQMPPADSETPEPDERLRMIRELRQAIEQSRERFESTGGRTVLRRLSHREYENTLVDLFGRRVDTLGLTADFPQESADQQIDTVGNAKVTSGFLLDQYFQAANRLVEMRLGKERLQPQTWHFTDNFRQYEELSGPHRSVFKYQYLCLYEQPNTDTRQGGYAHIEDFLAGVPVSGLYDIEVHAQAMHRDTHYDPKIFGIDFSEPFQLAVVPGDVSKGHIHYPQAIEPILASTLVPDEEPTWLKLRVWLEAGQTPRFIFPNGPYESRASVITVNKRYEKEFDPKSFRQGVSRAHILREGKLPHIRIGEVKIVGPVEEPGGSKEEIAVFGPDGFQAEAALDQLQRFAGRAYRRPLKEQDVARLKQLYEKRLAEGASARQAALDTVKMILCSPSFLYLSEATRADQQQLSQFDLAARLAYTLWAGPPDDSLLTAAASEQLSAGSELQEQTERMLQDERSERFVAAFVDGWLNLRDIGNLPPPRKGALSYYAENLPASMKQEARLFFRDLLDRNGSVIEFLEADYSFVDKKLARLYQLPEAETLTLADGFRRVEFADNVQRGGVLGMAGVMTVSANGVDTSPVTRGVWVSKNLLGISSPPPPDEVPAIDANVSGAKTIREKLLKHSEDQTCLECHRNIDPLGFALESFDPIGRWRTRYPKSQGRPPAEIDTTGKLPSGESYRDFASFKQILVESRRDLFTRHLVEQLLVYATGRSMSRGDQFEINDIVDRVKAENYGLRTLLNEVLASKIFHSP